MADPALLNRAGKVLLLAALAAYVLLRGVVPALTVITDDFPTYFTAAKIVQAGQDTARLYDEAWFREQSDRYGMGSQHLPFDFAPYPPPTALLLTPLTGVEPLTALRIVTAFNLAFLVCAMLLLSRIFAWRLIDSALFILLSAAGLLSCLRLGHPYILISTLSLLGYYLSLKGRPLLAGLCLGVFVPIKYYQVVVLAGFALQKQWRLLLGAGLAIVAVVLASIGVLGWKIHQIFLLDVIWNHLTGNLAAGPRFIAVFQSFDTLYERLFIFDPTLNPNPWVAAPQLKTSAVLATKGALLVAAAAALIKLARGASARAIAPSIGILGILVLLVAPGTTTYNFVLLWLPVALLIDYFVSQGERLPANLILCIYVLIGFIPYGHTYPFDGRGGLTVLAFPRLFLLLAMFVVCVGAVLRRGFSGQRSYSEVQSV